MGHGLSCFVGAFQLINDHITNVISDLKLVFFFIRIMQSEASMESNVKDASAEVITLRDNVC